MVQLHSLISILAFAFLSFVGSTQSTEDVQSIIDKCINVHGGAMVANGNFSFDFRKYHYTYSRNDGVFEYTRTHNESGIKDILNNQGITRIEDGLVVDLSEKKKKSYSNSVNSVHYFAFLPYFLNDDAVNKKLIGESQIKGVDYYKVQVTFDQEGGGDDHDDIYVYWIDKNDFSLDYLAYSFHVNGGGVRFRSAYNSRVVGGVTFQDYINYKHDKSTPVESLDKHYEENELIELSRIELLNIKSL